MPCVNYISVLKPSIFGAKGIERAKFRPTLLKDIIRMKALTFEKLILNL